MIVVVNFGHLNDLSRRVCDSRALPLDLAVCTSSILEEVHNNVLLTCLEIDVPFPALSSVEPIVVNYFGRANKKVGPVITACSECISA